MLAGAEGEPGIQRQRVPAWDDCVGMGAAHEEALADELIAPSARGSLVR